VSCPTSAWIRRGAGSRLAPGHRRLHVAAGRRHVFSRRPASCTLLPLGPTRLKRSTLDRHMKVSRRTLLSTLAAATIAGAVALSPRRSFLGRTVRWLCGEPGATQDVNDAADMIETEGWADDLEKLADDVTTEFVPVREKLPKAFVGGRLIPIGRLPSRFLELGGTWSDRNFEFVLGEAPWTSLVMLSWGHLRHAVIIFPEAPSAAPVGFHVRRVSERVFVVADFRLRSRESRRVERLAV
jgi:hypothetical protein